MDTRRSPTTQPWTESNIWLVRSFDIASRSRPVWISSQIESPSAVDYARAVADAAAAGGRWIVSLDDVLRAKMRAQDTSAMATWQRVAHFMKFTECRAMWSTV